MAAHPPDPQRRRSFGERPIRLRASRGLALGVLLSASLWGLLVVLIRGLLSWFR